MTHGDAIVDGDRVKFAWDTTCSGTRLRHKVAHIP